jgi:hypothetical protein
MWLKEIACISLLVPSAILAGQPSGTTTQTVIQRNTIGVLTASPSSSLTSGEAISFSYVLETAGAPAPTTETIQFYDNSTAIGTPQTIGSIPGSNLLPYSQVNTANGWMSIGSPTIAALTDAGPDGSSASATRLTLPSSGSQSQGVSYAITGASYASMAMTVTFWAKAAAATSLTIGITDNPGLNANGSGTCSLTTSYQRCTLTYTFPANANSGFILNLYGTGQGASTVDVWGVQVEQASSAGPYVSTIGTPRPTGGQGGTVSYTYSSLLNGSHSITAVYPGDTNFVGSSSNAVALSIGSATPTITLSGSASSPVTYGTSLTFTATLTSSAGSPTGAFQLLDNGVTVLGTGTLSGGVGTVTLSGANALAGGAHSLTAVYSGDAQNSAVTSSTLSFTINPASTSVSINVVSSENPSTYGDSVTFTVTVASTISGAIPTGTVGIVDNSTSTNLGTFTLNGSGVTTATVPLFNAGTHNLTVTYSGDANYH